VLKAYLVMTATPDSSTPAVVAPILLRHWQRGRAIDAEMMEVAGRQFAYYAALLPDGNPVRARVEAPLVQRARSYLGQFADGERIYQHMLAEASRVAPPARLTNAAPRAVGVMNAPDVPGAFTDVGWKLMEAAFRDSDRFFAGERWVLGDEGVASLNDRQRVVRDLRARYRNEYVTRWTAFLRGTVVAGGGGISEAARRLAAISGEQSPLLTALALVARHTLVDSTILAAFRPVHALVPPYPAQGLVTRENREYVSALAELRAALDQVANAPLPSDTASMRVRMQAAVQTLMTHAARAGVAARQLAAGLATDPAAAEAASAVLDLLLAPVNSADLALVAVTREVSRVQPTEVLNSRPTLAVLNFNVSAGARQGEFAPLSEGVAEMLMTELFSNRGLALVEYEQARQIRNLQNRGSVNRIDADAIARIGRILGVRYFVVGSVVVDGSETVRLDARVVEVVSGRVERQNTSTVIGKAEDLFALVSELGARVRGGLPFPNVPTTPGRRTIPSRVDQTRAVVLLGRGLQARDRGDMAAARRYYEEALALYPEFGRARALLAGLDRTGDGPGGSLPAPPTGAALAQRRRELNERGRALCADMEPVLAKFPLNPDAREEVTLAELKDLFAPGTGKLWALQQEQLRGTLEKQGAAWVVRADAPVPLSAPFVGFFNRAAQVSAALFPEGSPEPRVELSVRAVLSGRQRNVILTIGSQRAEFGRGTTSPAKMTWPSGRGASLVVRQDRGALPDRNHTIETRPGDWALFRVFARANKVQGGRAEWTNRGDAGTVVVEYDSPSGQRVLERAWLGGLTCTAQVTR
jgi:type VI protein secretion system component VasK